MPCFITFITHYYILSFTYFMMANQYWSPFLLLKDGNPIPGIKEIQETCFSTAQYLYINIHMIELFCGCKLYSGNSTNYTRMTLRQNCIYCQLQHTKLREYMESGEKWISMITFSCVYNNNPSFVRWPNLYVSIQNGENLSKNPLHIPLACDWAVSHFWFIKNILIALNRDYFYFYNTT